jgi:hypothetical protein
MTIQDNWNRMLYLYHIIYERMKEKAPLINLSPILLLACFLRYKSK